MSFTLRMSAETRRKLKIFRQNRRGFTSLVILATLLAIVTLLIFATALLGTTPTTPH